MSGADVMRFPCDFPIKVMGRATDGFRLLAREIVERHAGPLAEGRQAERLSRDGNFSSLTFTIQARNREQLDALYRELSGAESILFVL